jgi:branched-chain amino acid transport system ATP-binding protein
MITLQNVSAHYGQVQALRMVSLSLEPGKIFAVLGANGAGKTTLLRTVLGLTQTTGAVKFEGEDISRLPTHQRIRRGIAVVPEGRRLFSQFTVGENLHIGAINRNNRVEIDQDVEELCTAFPILRTRFTQPSGTLSGGEGQMLAIGRALMSRPKLLLLDEPSVGLMPTAVSEIFSMVAEICRKKGLTVLLVEQNAKKAFKIAHRVAVLELGGIAIEGEASDLKNDSRIKEAYLGAH